MRRMWCSVFDQHNLRHYTRECSQVYQRIVDPVPIIQSWTSTDLDGREYGDKCPYFDSCAITLDAGKCWPTDQKFTFIGEVGRVVNYDASQDPPIVSVTFNDGRTSYDFDRNFVKLERKSMYGKSGRTSSPSLCKNYFVINFCDVMIELWWVLRTPNQFLIQKRKGFNVTEPACSYDTTNDR